MTQQEKQIAIAQACGWRDCHKSLAGFDDGDGITDCYVIGIPPNQKLHRKLHDYFNDLNMMHEAEKILIGRGDWSMCDYDQELSVMTRSWKWNATAAQRAEAFGKTLNLW